MNIRPLNDRVLVKRDAAEDTTPGGIIVPENLKEKQVRGTVVAVGPGRLNSDGVQVRIAGIEIGQSVMFGKYAGIEVETGAGQGKDQFVMLREDDLMAVVTK